MDNFGNQEKKIMNGYEYHGGKQCDKLIYCFDCEHWFRGSDYESGDCNLGCNHFEHHRQVHKILGDVK